MTDLPEKTFKTIGDVDDIEGRNFYADAVHFGADPKVMLHQIATRSRDNVRSVMQWDDSPFAGFSQVRPQADVNDNFTKINVQRSLMEADSVLNYYRQLIALHRSHDSWLTGSFTDYLPADQQVYVYSRTSERERTLVVLNFSSADRQVDLPVAAQVGHNQRLLLSNYEGAEPLSASLHLRPWEARIYVGPGPQRQLATR